MYSKLQLVVSVEPTVLTNIYVWETITSTRTQNVSVKPPSLLAALAPGRQTGTSWPVTTDERVCSGISRQWSLRTHSVWLLALSRRL